MASADHPRQDSPTGTPCLWRGETPLDRTHIKTVFQPIVDLAGGEIAGFEGLSRPTALSPFTGAGEMFDWAEKHGALWELEEVTRSLSLDAARDWPPGVRLFLNTSPQVFADDRFARTIAAAVGRVPGLTPGRVVLEITERSGQQYSGALEAQVRLVREQGFQIAIDDVGAGASGFNRIMSLRPNWLKLDRALIDQIDQDRTRQNLVRFFLQFARLSGVQVIAEGIEREAELATLVDLGVAFGQGYFLARPGARGQGVDAQSGEWLRRRRSGAEAARSRDPRAVGAAHFARPVESARADQPVGEVAAILLKRRNAPGIAVVDGRRLVGWCHREQVLRAAQEQGAARPVGALAGIEPAVATPQTTLAEALDLALAREEHDPPAPLIILDHGRICGMLTVRDLLQAAAGLLEAGTPRTSAITGLPGRVRCDEHLAGLVRGEGADHHGEPSDGALIDVRGFREYNRAYGYDSGDRLLKRVAGLIEAVVVKGDDGLFVGHLGDDRFIVTGPATVLRVRLERLMRQFDRSIAELEGEGAGPAGGADAATLRIVLIRNAAARIGEARDFYRLVEEAKVRRSALHSPRGESVLIDPGMAGARPTRLSA